MIVINELEYIENILKSHIKPEDMSIRKLIKYIIKYYLKTKKDLDLKSFIELILNELREFQFPIYYYQEYLYFDFIKNYCKKMINNSNSMILRNTSEINITKAEIDTIMLAKSEHEQKVLFTLYVLAKLYPYYSGWVNFREKDIFKLANVNMTKVKQLELLSNLYKDNLIQINHSLNRSGYKVELQIDSPTVMSITNFSNIGNQFLAKFKDGWTMCKKCGRMMKQKQSIGHPKLYCKKCANELDKENNRKRQQNYRETLKT